MSSLPKNIGYPPRCTVAPSVEILVLVLLLLNINATARLDSIFLRGCGSNVLVLSMVLKSPARLTSAASSVWERSLMERKCRGVMGVVVVVVGSSEVGVVGSEGRMVVVVRVRVNLRRVLGLVRVAVLRSRREIVKRLAMVRILKLVLCGEVMGYRVFELPLCGKLVAQRLCTKVSGTRGGCLTFAAIAASQCREEGGEGGNWPTQIQNNWHQLQKF